jgi:hypothetical protein
MANITCTQDYCVFGLCSTHDIVKHTKHQKQIISATGALPPPSPKDINRSSFWLCCFVFLRIPMMDKVQKPINPGCYRPSSEHFNINISLFVLLTMFINLYCSGIEDLKSPSVIYDHLCGLVVSVSGYTSRGPGLDSWSYQIF